MLSFWRYVARCLTGHAKLNLAVALAAASATTVLTGALLVGDSVRGSLKDLVLDRLGSIQEMLLSDHYFRQQLVTELNGKLADGSLGYSTAAGVILLPQTSAETASSESKRRANQVLLLGGDAAFWKLFPSTAGDAWKPPVGEQVILNQALADDLQVAVGDRITLRLPSADQIPADSVLARKTDLVRSMPQLEVVAILPNEGAGRFSLRPNQSLPRNAYVDLERIQRSVQQDQKLNAILVGSASSTPLTVEQSRELGFALSPTLEDYGLGWNRVSLTWRDETIYDWYQLTSQRMMLPDEVLLAAQSMTKKAEIKGTDLYQGDGEAFFTYMANRIEKLDPETKKVVTPLVPYSTITGVEDAYLRSVGGTASTAADSSSAGPLLAEDEITLNQWTADRLNAKIGDTIRITYFDPETTHGEAVELHHDFRLAFIAPLTAPKTPYQNGQPAEFDQRPAVLNDPDLTPTVEGITDQDSIDDWDPPFPYNPRLIQPEDETYWDFYRTTPKALVRLADAQRLWGSRFGQATSYRFPNAPPKRTEYARDALLTTLATKADVLGMGFTAVRRRDLASAAGTTPFDVLFLALSMFIIAAALMLVSLLFRLGVEQRATELGVLTALGFPPQRIARLFLSEGAIVAALGGFLGIALGVGYAWIMLAGLRTWWSGAVVTPFMHLHIGYYSLPVGWLIGLLTSLLTIQFALRRVVRTSARRLLSGQVEQTPSWSAPRRSGRLYFAMAVVAAGAIVLGLVAAQLHAEAQAGAFVGSGMLLLCALLMGAWIWLRGGRQSTVKSWSLRKLAGRNAGRNPLRSTITLGLVAVASFLIVAIGAFQQSPTRQGAGGFNLIGESSQPVFADLNNAKAREDVLLNDATLLDRSLVLSLRVRAGDDASCRNLYQATHPRVLGVPPAMRKYFDQSHDDDFVFAANAPDPDQGNPWNLLAATGKEEAIPVILDMNTAMYSLHLYGGVGQEFTFDYDGEPVRFRVVGLLSNSLLQGSLLIAEESFLQHFPSVGGYRMFLIQTPADKQQQVANALENALEPQGLDVQESAAVLADLLAVQNTYISTFQSLGMLGLLLGTFGLAAVQVRSVVERRGELALMRAIGFGRRRLAALVMLENLLLLFAGLGLGLLAAILAVLPYWWLSQAGLPAASLLVMLLIVAVVGVLTGLAAVRATLKAPLIAALRGE